MSMRMSLQAPSLNADTYPLPGNDRGSHIRIPGLVSAVRMGNNGLRRLLSDLRHPTGLLIRTKAQMELSGDTNERKSCTCLKLRF